MWNPKKSCTRNTREVTYFCSTAECRVNIWVVCISGIQSCTSHTPLTTWPWQSHQHQHDKTWWGKATRAGNRASYTTLVTTGKKTNKKHLASIKWHSGKHWKTKAAFGPKELNLCGPFRTWKSKSFIKLILWISILPMDLAWNIQGVIAYWITQKPNYWNLSWS